jgi:hypothetical protein
MNLAALAMALAGLLIWLFCCPYRHKEQDALLDRTRELISHFFVLRSQTICINAQS